MSTINLTPAQERALFRMPSNGAWRSGTGEMSRSMENLSIRGLVNVEYGSFDGRVGWRWHYRLTPDGIAFKAART